MELFVIIVYGFQPTDIKEKPACIEFFLIKIVVSSIKLLNINLALSGQEFFDQLQPGEDESSHFPYLKSDPLELGSWNAVCLDMCPFCYHQAPLDGTHLVAVRGIIH